MAVDCGAIRAAVGLADNHVSRGYGPGLGCDGQLTGVGDKTEEERAGDGTGCSWRIPAILAWRTLAVMSAKGAMTGGASVANSRERFRYSVSDSAMRMVQKFATWWHQAAGCEPFSSPVQLTKGAIVARDAER